MNKKILIWSFAIFLLIVFITLWAIKKKYIEIAKKYDGKDYRNLDKMQQRFYRI